MAYNIQNLWVQLQYEHNKIWNTEIFVCDKFKTRRSKEKSRPLS